MSKRKKLEAEIEEANSEEIIKDEEPGDIEPTTPKKRRRRQKLVVEEETQMDRIKFFIVAMLIALCLVMSPLLALVFDIGGLTYAFNFVPSLIMFIIGIILAVILMNMVIFEKSKSR